MECWLRSNQSGLSERIALQANLLCTTKDQDASSGRITGKSDLGKSFAFLRLTSHRWPTTRTGPA